MHSIPRRLTRSHTHTLRFREHSLGLNCGRWDYIFSFVKRHKAHAGFLTPDRAHLTMTAPFMQAYVRLLIRTCHSRGTFAMGGMAAQIPIRGGGAEADKALAAVRADKLREVQAGHDGEYVKWMNERMRCALNHDSLYRTEDGSIRTRHTGQQPRALLHTH